MSENKMNIPFSPPDVGEEEIREVSEALRSGWITTGPRVKELERKIAAWVGTARCVCLNSQTACAELARRAHDKGLNVWTYSGYTYEKLLEMAQRDPAVADLLARTDVLVEGPFLQEQRSLDLLFRGSKNQRIIDMEATRRAGETVLYEQPQW